MADPDFATDPHQQMKLGKEYARLGKIVNRYRRLRKAEREHDDARAIIDSDESEEELRALAREEITEIKGTCEHLESDLLDELLTADEGAVDSVIIEIRAGTGGEEAALFARDLYQMYHRYAERIRFKSELIEASPTDMGGFREVIFAIRGEDVFRMLGYEGGGHRVQRIPETETQGRIHTSAATVAVLPEMDQIDVEIDWEKDVLEHVSRAGGPGGQNVNKVSSAIKLEHVPTGITVSMRDDKSQHKNRAKARRIMASRVHDYHLQKQQSSRDSVRKSMIGSGDRSQRIRTYNFPQNRLTDHRLNLTLYQLDQVMMGNLDELVQALRAHDRAQRLADL